VKYKPLTPKQKNILDYITSFVDEHGYSPSHEEIAKHFGRSLSTVHQYLSALREKGYLEKVDFQQRSIKPVPLEVEIPLSGILCESEALEQFASPEPVSIPITMLGGSDFHFGFRVRGSGWAPDQIFDGDVLIVRRQKSVTRGARFVVKLPSGQGSIGKISKVKGGFKFTPTASGEVIVTKKLSILGKVVNILPSTVSRKKSFLLRESVFEVDRIITGDVLESLSRIPDNSVHLAITSPPYNVGIQYDTHDDRMKYQEYLDWLEDVWRETKRLLVPGGRFAINIAPTGIKDFVPIHHDFITQQRKLGMKFRTEIIWYKQTMLKRTAWGSFKSPSNPHIIPSWEYVLVFSKEVDRLEGSSANADITSEEFINFSDGFWSISPETKRNGHPAPFPEELIYRLIKFYSYKGNTVLDMFGGTGTVAVVAQKTGRHYIHIDVSEQYNQIAQSRLEKIQNQAPLFNIVPVPQSR
jgi:DNA modification methylase/SOS-response transcriptional repressor LexA